MIDLHTHILPGIDDGSRDINMSLKMLKLQQEQGVKEVVFTPHFYYERQSMEHFLERRARAYESVKQAMAAAKIKLNVKVGAEVHYTTALAHMDISELAFEGTSFILIELPSRMPPLGAETVFRNIFNQGYTPILAHIERFAYVEKDPTMLYDWVNQGCMVQTNSEAADSRFIKKCLGWNLVHVMTSDCHNLDDRRPNLMQGLEKLDEDDRRYFITNAASVFRNIDPRLKRPIEPKKTIFGGWK